MNHDENEWLAQEIALDRERRQRDGAHDDALVAGYRKIARALAEPPAATLPTDFASRMARRVSQHAEIDARFEQRLVSMLVICFALSGVVVAWIYGGDWLQASAPFAPLTSDAAGKWLLAVLACVGMSWAAGLFGRRPAD